MAYVGTKFQCSQDNSTWTDIYEVEGDIHQGKNIYKIPSITDFSCRYFRAIETSDPLQGYCMFAEISIFGYKYYKEDPDF